jgi:CRISPR-associated protein Csb2
MLEIEIACLTGRYVATAESGRHQAEWPPHPARVFSALVAAWAPGTGTGTGTGTEAGGDDEERVVLEWLERLPAPEIVASAAHQRTTVTHYVPVNDTSVIGLGETERRAAKLGDLLADLDEARGASDARSARRAASIEAKTAKQLDVSAKVSTAGSTNPKTAVEMLPARRNRQPRQWPSVSPVDPVVILRFPDVEPSPRAVEVLDRLCARVAQLGHSSSLVAMRAVDRPPGGAGARWVPDATGSITLRWVQQGQLRALQQSFDLHQAARPRSLPKLGIAYRDTAADATSPAAGDEPLVSNLAGEWWVFSLPRRFPATRTVKIATVARDAIISHAPEPVHPVISGHRPDGRPSLDPHLAVLGLPFVAHEQATGQLLGLAVVAPTEISPDARAQVLAALGRWVDAGAQLTLGRQGVVHLERALDGTKLVGLRRGTWSGPSTRWVTATPLALPNHPGDLVAGTSSARRRAWARAGDAVVRACGHVGLPEPVDVEVSLAPILQGSERARRFPAFKQGGNARALVHAAVTFDDPVAGPLVLGSGRFLGLGLMRPVVPGEPGGR